MVSESSIDIFSVLYLFLTNHTPFYKNQGKISSDATMFSPFIFTERPEVNH